MAPWCALRRQGASACCHGRLPAYCRWRFHGPGADSRRLPPRRLRQGSRVVVGGRAARAPARHAAHHRRRLRGRREPHGLPDRARSRYREGRLQPGPVRVSAGHHGAQSVARAARPSAGAGTFRCAPATSWFTTSAWSTAPIAAGARACAAPSTTSSSPWPGCGAKGSGRVRKRASTAPGARRGSGFTRHAIETRQACPYAAHETPFDYRVPAGFDVEPHSAKNPVLLRTRLTRSPNW